MNDYFARSYRTPSPCPDKAKLAWYSAPVHLSDHDLDVVNVFLNIFTRNITGFFPVFRGLNVTTNTRPEYVLAAAAVGGLYCSISGSIELSKAMYNDSRRLVLASVSEKLATTNPTS